MVSRYLTILIILGILSLPRVGEADDGVFILNTSTGEPYTTPEETGFQDVLIAELFSRLGKKARVVRYDASARALHNANNNVDQGVAMRIKGLEQKFPNLVMVPESIITNDFVAYSNGLDLVTDSWESLSPYSVLYIHGWQIFDRNLSFHNETTTVTSPKQMFGMINLGRADVALYERWQGLWHAGHSTGKIVVHEPPLAYMDMYIYMHKAHRDLVPLLSETLTGMKADGSYQAIFEKTLGPLANP